jgi:hypothetical protein
MLCEDLKLPHAYFVPLIVQEMKDQIQDYFQHFPSSLQNRSEIPNGHPDGFGEADRPEVRLLIKVRVYLLNNYKKN